MNINPNMSWRRDALLLFLAVLLFFCMGLSTRPYLVPSEARYIELPRQMLATGDWLTPRIDGVPYFEKPPLFYWMQASVMQFFGAGEFAGRIATALLAALTCVVTYAAARLLYGRLSGLLAATVLATCALGYGLSRVAMLDMPVSLFMTSCFVCFLAAQHTGQRHWYWGMYVAAALAVLTKGLIGMVIPGLVIGVWILFTKRWRILAEARLLTGLIVFLIIAAPWHVLMARAHPDFLNFYFIHEHFTRYLTDSHKRLQPWWFFPVIVLAGLLPWTSVTPHSLRRLLQTKGIPQNVRQNNLFLLFWIVLPLLFFSASHSKLAPYIFPIFPPLSIVLGDYLAGCWEGRIAARALRNNCFFIVALFAAIIAGYYAVPLPVDANNKLDFATGISFTMLIPIIIALAGLLYVAVRKSPAPVLIGALVLFAATFDISTNTIVAALDRATVKPLAAVVRERLHEGDSVVAYGSYFQDLPVYLNRNVMVADYLGELEFGATHYPETQGWMISSNQFWQLCAVTKRPLYVFMKKTTFDGIAIPPNCRLRRLANYGKTVLLEKESK